jgi:hypothetical protein
MAIFTTSAGIEDLTGKLNQTDRIVMRQKTFRLPNGKIIKRGPKEAFARDKRDYKRSPRTAAEQVQNSKWQAVCQEASRIMHNAGHPRNKELYERWIRQANGQADPVIGKRIIAQFGNFVRAILLRELENGNTP